MKQGGIEQRSKLMEQNNQVRSPRNSAHGVGGTSHPWGARELPHIPFYNKGLATLRGKPAPAGPWPEVCLHAWSEPCQVSHGGPSLSKLFLPAPKLPRLTQPIKEKAHVSHICHQPSKDWGFPFRVTFTSENGMRQVTLMKADGLC